MIVILIVALILLKVWFDFNVIDFLKSPRVAEWIEYIREVIIFVWDHYLRTAFFAVWDIILELIARAKS